MFSLQLCVLSQIGFIILGMQYIDAGESAQTTTMSSSSVQPNGVEVVETTETGTKTQTTTTTMTSSNVLPGEVITETTETRTTQPPSRIRQGINTVITKLNSGKDSLVATGDRITNGRISSGKDKIVNAANGIYEYAKAKKDGIIGRNDVPAVVACVQSSPPEQKRITMSENLV